MTKKRTDLLAIPILDPGRQGLATGWKPWPYPTSHLRWRGGDKRAICGIKDATPCVLSNFAEGPSVWTPHACNRCVDLYEEATGRVGLIPRMPDPEPPQQELFA